MKASYKHEVRRRTERRPYLFPIFDDIYGIAERIHDYDRSFFVVFNKNNQKYEIHSLDYPGNDTHSLTIREDALDQRAMRHLWENDLRVHGAEIFRRVEISEEKARIREARARKNFDIDFAKEHQSLFAKDAWQ